MRIVLCPRLFFLDLGDPKRGVRFFTLIAGTGILGSQFVGQLSAFELAKALLTTGRAMERP